MAFYPENRFPKKGIPVYNGNGDQRDLSDPRFRYQDNLENTTKVFHQSTDNYFGTTGAAMARAEQLGCNGYHTALADDGVYYYLPCSDATWYAERMQQFESSLNFTYIGNYRVLTWDSPFNYVQAFNGWIIETAGAVLGDPVKLGDPTAAIPNDIAIDFRYSVDGKSWSLWANVGTALTGFSQGYTSNNDSTIFSIPLDPSKSFYPEFRFTSVVVNTDGTLAYETDEPIDPSIVILDFDLDLTYATGPSGPSGSIDSLVINRPVPNCSNEKSNRPVVFDDCNYTFNPYAINKAVNLYKDLSLVVNKVFGFETNYYSVQPQARGKDVVLKEYTLFDVVDEQCVKVMVPSNQFPDNRTNYDPFGIQFDEPFEIHIDKTYFENIFGRGSQPRKRDIIYFPLTNRIYEINSTYLFRDFMYSPVYYKIELKKYSPKSNTYFKDPAYKEELDGIALTTEKLFGAEVEAEEQKIAKPEQYSDSTQRRQEDPTRSYIYKNLPIVGYDLNNNWTIVFNNYYDMSDAFVSDSEFVYQPNKYREALRYKNRPLLESDGEVSYTCWFSLKNYINEDSLAKKPYSPAPITKVSEDANQILYSSHPYKHNLTPFRQFSDNPEGYVAISTDANHSGGFKVLTTPDEFKFSVANPNLPYAKNTANWKMQKAQARNLIDGTYIDGSGLLKGMRIDLVHSGTNDAANNNYVQQGSIEIILNDLTYDSRLQFTPEQGEWYGLVVNISNKYKQMGINIWKMSYDPTNPGAQQSSDLVKVHEDYRTLTKSYIFDAPSDIETNVNNPFYGTDNNAYKIYTSPLLLSNVRLFKNMIDIDKQSIVLNQNTVRDEQLAYIIDNAKPQLILPKFARNR